MCESPDTETSTLRRPGPELGICAIGGAKGGEVEGGGGGGGGK